MRIKTFTTAYFFFFSVILAACFHIAFSDQACAWSNNPTVNTPICTASYHQRNPQITSDGLGGAIITWEDNRNDNTDIYARRVNASGTSQWIANGVGICTADANQTDPQITTDGSGGAIITWQDNRSGNWNIYAQRVDASGNVPSSWPPNGVAICTVSGEQESPNIISDGSGGAIITWQDNRSGNYDIGARRVDASGTAQWTPNGVAICTASGNQLFPQITTDGSGGAIITWVDNRSDNTDIYARRVDASGFPQWTANGVAICTASGDKLLLQITTDGSGGAIITWEDNRSDNTDIYAQRVDASGNVPSSWPPNGVAICTASGNQLFPQITTDGSGGAIITWGDNRLGTSTGWDIYVQRVDASGNVPSSWPPNGVAICTVGNPQYRPQITTDGSGGAIITWEDERSDNTDIYARRVDASGTRQWTALGVAICTASGHQYIPQIISDGSGGAIITWEDERSGNWDIYAQQIAKDGTLGKTHRPLPFLPLLLLE